MIKEMIIMMFLFATIATAQQMPMLTYTPLSDAARKSGQLQQYDKMPTETRKVTLGDAALEVETPLKANAYDVIPVNYKLKKPAYGAGWMAVEAVAFEDVGKVNDKPLYDLAIPGNMEVEIEYLGSISADYDPEKYIPLTANPNTPISPFPPYNRDKMVRSSTIRSADIVWFKFRITNTGDTILDPEGFSGCFVEPFLTKLDENGEEQWKAKPTNLFVRFLEYLYPGDSVDLWVNFSCPKAVSKKLGLESGNYRIDYRLVARFYDKYDWMANIWSGTEFARLEVPIKVAEKAVGTPVKTTMKMVGTENRMPGHFAKFEEFMTSFNIYPYHFNQPIVEDTIYLQVAPWTKAITIKLIANNPQRISVIRVPIEISQDSLAIKYNPENIMTLEKNGCEEPVIISQSMPAMRSGFQLGPFPEKAMRDYLQEQKDLGINAIVNTAGDWWIWEIGDNKRLDISSACYKYFYDVLVRELDMKVFGWSVYPPSAPHWYQYAEKILKKKLIFAMQKSGYTSTGTVVTSVDMADPVVPEVIAAWVIYQYKRWGDTWYTTKDGRVPIDIEDTWGWMRDDINLRYGIGALGMGRFREWAKEKYDTIAKANKAWSSNYIDFKEIDPQANQTIMLGGYSYDNPSLAFHDFSPAMEDWDIFRTELRMEVMRKTNEIIRRTIPGAQLVPRTEGANLPVRGDGKSENSHLRHLYYSQRRNAFVYDVIKEKDVIHFYSDYTTMPYTDAQWRQAMREMVADGIIPMLLPQFDHMRDILLNPYFGMEYKMHYNLDKPSKGIMVHCLRAAYPWWKATYEEGGAPGILWADYLCDGFATETQKRELKLLSEYFRKMKRD